MNRPMPPDGAGKAASEPAAEDLARLADQYFLRTKEIVRTHGDARVTYAVFLRRPVLSATKIATSWLERVAATRGTKFDIELNYPEGEWVGAGEPLLYISGSFMHLVDCETTLLQKVGPPCVAAYNAFSMCSDLPNVGFLAMDARHAAGSEMAELMAYAASVGSAAARRQGNAKGFVGNATTATAAYFGQSAGLGTMP